MRSEVRGQKPSTKSHRTWNTNPPKFPTEHGTKTLPKIPQNMEQKPFKIPRRTWNKNPPKMPTEHGTKTRGARYQAPSCGTRYLTPSCGTWHHPVAPGTVLWDFKSDRSSFGTCICHVLCMFIDFGLPWIPYCDFLCWFLTIPDYV